MDRISQTKTLSPKVLEFIEHSLYAIQYGSLILTVQDGYVVKMERTEKVLVSSKNKDVEYVKWGKPTEKHPLQAKILAELQGLKYGQIIIRVEAGQVEQIEKTEKRRVHELEGIHGDGI